MSKIADSRILKVLKKAARGLAQEAELSSSVFFGPFLIFAFVSFNNMPTQGQENLIRWDEKEPLEWYHFGGKVNDTSEFDAECYARISYHYHFKSLKDFQFSVFADFNKNLSWVRKENQTQALLRHEQLHFDIAELVAASMKDIFEQYHYTKNFKTEIQMLFDKTSLKYHSLQHRYDVETKHSLDKKKQKEWELYIAQELGKVKLKKDVASSTVKHDDRRE